MTSLAVSDSALGRRPSELRRNWQLALAFGAPLGALLAGAGAEWLDFRALRVPFLLVVGVCVLATALALNSRLARHGARTRFLTRMLLGVATWGAGGVVYVVIHTLRGEAFDAERFGAQWSQAIALIGVHALLLGLPTGLAVATVFELGRPRARLFAAKHEPEVDAA